MRSAWTAIVLVSTIGCNDLGRELKRELLPKEAVKRNVPKHDVAILADCPTESLEKIEAAIAGAIEIGAPLYNQGDHQGCFDTYEKASREIDRTIGQCTKVRAALIEGITIAQKRTSATGKAWAMRDAFDGVLDVTRRKLVAPVEAGPVETKLPRFVPRRDVPHHEMRLLEGCPESVLVTTEGGIQKAIDIGAPLYNQNNTEACYRIYESTARELSQKASGCSGVKRALDVGLSRAEQQKGWEAKAWAMRDTFDGLLDVIDRAHQR